MGHTVAQSSCQEATARHIMDIPGGVLSFNRTVDWRIEHETPSIPAERKVLDFTPPTLWPPNSPDLNPVDYSIWILDCRRKFTDPE